MSDKKPFYSKCINCGRYIESEIKDKSLFCNNKCYENYSCCNICNQYYKTEDTHDESLKCKVVFDINQNKKPYIKQTLLKLCILGNPLFSIEMISEKLSNRLKLPLFISEKFRIRNQFTLLEIKNHINQRIEKENLQNFFIFLCNTYNIEFISELFTEFSFDKIISIDSEKSANNSPEIQICENCGNMNSFFETGNEHERECLICGSASYKKPEEDVTIANRFKNYQECKSFISSASAYKYINFKNVSETVTEIVRYLAYT